MGAEMGRTCAEGGRTGIATAEELLEQPNCQPGNRARRNTADTSDSTKQVRAMFPQPQECVCVLGLLQTQWNSALHKHRWASQMSHMGSQYLASHEPKILVCVYVCILENSAPGNTLEHAENRPNLSREASPWQAWRQKATDSLYQIN